MMNMTINTFGSLYSKRDEQTLDKHQSLPLMHPYKKEKSRLKCFHIDFAY